MQLKCLILGILFLFIGASFFYGKAIPRMNWWNELTPKEQENIRVEALGRNVGSVLLLAGIIFEMAAIFPTFQEKAFIWCIVGWLILTGIDVYDMEKSKRYLIQERKQGQKTGGAV